MYGNCWLKTCLDDEALYWNHEKMIYLSYLFAQLKQEYILSYLSNSLDAIIFNTYDSQEYIRILYLLWGI